MEGNWANKYPFPLQCWLLQTVIFFFFANLRKKSRVQGNMAVRTQCISNMLSRSLQQHRNTAWHCFTSFLAPLPPLCLRSQHLHLGTPKQMVSTLIPATDTAFTRTWAKVHGFTKCEGQASCDRSHQSQNVIPGDRTSIWLISVPHYTAFA